MTKPIVASHERSGTHLLINSIGLNFDFPDDWGGKVLGGRTAPTKTHTLLDPWKDIPPCNICSLSRKNNDHRTLGLMQRRHQQDTKIFFQHEAESKDEKIYKTHCEPEFFKNSAKILDKHYKIFYMTRDPKDCLTSFYLYLTSTDYGKTFKDITFEDFLFNLDVDEVSYISTNDWSKYKNFLERWFYHNKKWKASKAHVFSFADVVNDFENQIERISKILNRPMPEEIVKPTLKHSCVKPRKGEENDWQNHMSIDLADKVDDYLSRLS